MISQALGRLRVGTTATEQLDDLLFESGISPRRSSTNPPDTPISSPVDNITANFSSTHVPKITKREQKRYGNNLFGSGKLRDDVHPRSVRGTGRSASSTLGPDTSTISRTLRTKFRFLRPGFPEADSSDISAPASLNLLIDRESLSTPQTTLPDSSPNVSTETQPSHAFQPNAFKRPSLALEEMIREFEEEAQEARVDDDIILLRSRVIDQPQVTVNDGDHLVSCDRRLNTQSFFLNRTHRSRNRKVMGKSSLLRHCPATAMRWTRFQRNLRH